MTRTIKLGDLVNKKGLTMKRTLRAGDIAAWCNRLDNDNLVELDLGLLVRNGPGGKDYRLEFDQAGSEPGVCSQCDYATAVRDVDGDWMCFECQAQYEAQS